jgi:hypothetical protein
MEIIDKLSQEAISSIEELEEGRLVEVVEGIDAGLNTAKQISESYNDDGCDMRQCGRRGIWRYVDHNGGGEYVSAVALVNGPRHKELLSYDKDLVAIFCKH